MYFSFFLYFAILFIISFVFLFVENFVIIIISVLSCRLGWPLYCLLPWPFTRPVFLLSFSWCCPPICTAAFLFLFYLWYNFLFTLLMWSEMFVIVFLSCYLFSVSCYSFKYLSSVLPLKCAWFFTFHVMKYGSFFIL